MVMCDQLQGLPRLVLNLVISCSFGQFFDTLVGSSICCSSCVGDGVYALCKCHW